MWSQKFRKAAQEIPIEARRFYKKRYPAFVSERAPQPSLHEVPVFMFHSVEHDSFRAQLEFLKSNYYQTLTLEDFMHFLKGRHRLERPSVLLTFDDGDKSWYQVAYPLLKDFGFHAVGFVVPAFLRNKPEPSGWLSWSEVSEMDCSGVFDIQSHTFRHDRIFTDATLVDFFHPGFEHNPLGLDTPWIDEEGEYTNCLPWGTPIYHHSSRFAGRPRFLDSVHLRHAASEWVACQGGADFFAQPRWRQALKHFYKSQIPGYFAVQFDRSDDRDAAILADLISARDMLQEKLHKEIRHLCYPQGAGSLLAIQLSQQAGYHSNFWVETEQHNRNCQGDSLYHICRLKDDYIFRLPGHGRKSLIEIFTMKLHRRAQKVNIY